MKERIFLNVLCLLTLVSMLPCEAQRVLDKESPVAASAKSPLFEFEDSIVSKDPTVQLEPLTEEMLKRPEFAGWTEADPGFQKWMITFHEIPGKPPYAFQQKRTAQRDSNAFMPVEGLSPMEILKAKLTNKNSFFMLSVKGYLPGEEVTLRLTTRDKGVFKEITFYPRPLILKKPSGQILARAKLVAVPISFTSYNIDISGIGEKEKYLFLSKSGHEKFEQKLEGPTFMNYTPEVLGLKGGIGNVELQLEDGSCYKFSLPWGVELISYLKGEK